MESSPLQSHGPTKYINSLDGIRALCILAVMGHHFGYCNPGWIGVEMFFVLSGFLITTLLCQENEKTGTIALGRFWIRRAFRLLPIYWLYIGIVTIAIVMRRPGDWAANSPWSPGLFIASLWGYFVNFAPGKMWKHQLGTYHLWSLAMEEQFYFCWPFLCIIALKLKRPWMLPLAIFVLSIIPRLASVPEPYASVMSYPPIGIVVGCTVALLFYFGRDGRGFRVIISPSARNLAAITCVACLAILGYRTQMWGDNATRPWADRWLIPIYAWPFAILIAGFWYGQPIALGRVLSFKPLTYIGRISYGMYLYHMCLNYFVRNILIWIGDEMGIHIRFAFYVASYILFVMAVASASYYLIEKPLLKIGARFRGPATPAKVASRREVDEPLSVSLALNAEAN